MAHWQLYKPEFFQLNVKQYFHSRYFGEFWAVATNLLTPVASFAAMLIIMKCVNPTDLGVFQTVFLVAPYFALAPLGVFNGLRRNIAFYNGQGNFEKVRRQNATSKFVAHVTAAIGVVTGTFVFCYYWYSGASTLTLLCCVGLIVCLALFSYNTYFAAVFSGFKAFKELGNVNVVRNVVSVVGAAFPVFIGAFGLVLRRILSTTSVLTVRLFSNSENLSTKARLYKDEYRDLVVSGFPIMLSGYLGSIMVVADRSVIAAFMTAEDLGHYALAGYLLSAVVLIPQSFSLILYPKAAEAFGRTGKPQVLRKYIAVALVVNLAALLPLGLFCYYFLESIVVHLFPDYIEGLKCAQIACFTAVLLSYSGVNIVFMVLKRNLVYQLSIGVGFVAVWLFGHIAVTSGYGLEGVAFVRGGATLIVAISSVSYAFFLTTRPAEGFVER